MAPPIVPDEHVVTQIPSLQDFEPTVLWLKVAKLSIAVSAATGNKVKFLALFRALPKSVQTDFENLLDSTADDAMKGW